MKRLFTMIALMLLVASCANEIDDNGSILVEEGKVLYASIEGEDSDTKVYADNQLRILWNQNDCIKVFRDNTWGEYHYLGKDGTRSGQFKSNIIYGTSTVVEHTYAVYPFSESTLINSQGILSLLLPAVQEYEPNTFAAGVNTMVSVSE